MKLRLLLILSLLFGNFFSNAQVSEKYKELAQKPDANYYQIVKEASQEFKQKDLTVLKNKKAFKQFQRWAYHWENKVSKEGFFPKDNASFYNAKILDSKGKIVNSNSNLQKNNTVMWTNIGPEQSDLDNNGYSNFPQMGRLNAFLRIPNPTSSNQDVLFVGAPNGGIWKSTDGGASWAPKLDFLSGIGVTDIKTVDGTNTTNYQSTPIYVSTGDYDGDHVKSIGVLKSTDGGETFLSTNLTFDISSQATLGDLIVIDANTVFVGETGHIKKTTDGGTTWTNAYSPPQSYSPRFGRAARNGNEIMITGIFGDIFYTSDYTNDANWATVVNPSSFDKAAVTVDDNGDFFIQNSSGQVKKFNKTNSTFSDVGNIPPGYNSQQGYNQALIVTNGLMITGEFNGQISADNGATWTRSINGYWNPNAPNDSSPSNGGAVTSAGVYVHSDHHRMGKLAPGTAGLPEGYQYWTVNDGGLNYLKYDNGTVTTKYLSGKVKVTQSYSTSINPNTNDGSVVIANQDNDGMSKKGSTWYAISLGDGIQSAINYNNPDIRYASGQNGVLFQTTTSFQNELGGNGISVQVPLDPQTAGSFYFPLEMHKTDPNVLYAGGTTDVYKIEASNGGLTINVANSGLNGNVRDIATHGNSVMASTSSEIKFSSNQGTSWATVTGTGINGGNITSVDYNATNTNIMYASVGGYTANQKVFKSLNGGANWTSISGNLPNIVVNEIMLKQGQSTEYLFAATNLGVYFTSDGGTNWSKLGGISLPNSDVKDIEINYSTNELVAATFGRGLWDIDIQNSVLSTNDNSNLVEKDVVAYPNPVSDILTVLDTEGYNYMIINVVGGIVQKGKITNNTIDVSGLVNNVYMVRIFNDKTSMTKKIIKK